MTASELASAMSELSGQRCSAACLVQNRSRFFIVMIAAATAGAVVGAVVHQIFVGAILVALLIAASAPLFDRRILGLTDTGVVQARAAAFTTKPTAMLPPPGEVGLTKFGRNAVFDLGGVKYLGATGGRDFAASLTERTPA